MPEPRAQRTLVKSPPELWAEISDVSMLARHLGEFGDIRITRMEAETTVVWEGDRARGTVNLEPSGWGTKVTITAEAIAPPEPVEEPVAAEEPEAEAVVVDEEPEPEPEPEPEAVAEEKPEAEVAAEPEPEPEPVVVAKKAGFFARLFARRAKAAAPAPVTMADAPRTEISMAAFVAEPDTIAAIHTPTVAAPEPEPVAEVGPEPEPVAEAEPVTEPELEGEITVTAAEPLDDERVEAVLVGVLDDLGSAHHRPFSRG